MEDRDANLDMYLNVDLHLRDDDMMQCGWGSRYECGVQICVQITQVSIVKMIF